MIDYFKELTLIVTNNKIKIMLEGGMIDKEKRYFYFYSIDNYYNTCVRINLLK